MLWNWELPDWPEFIYDHKNLSQKESEFLLGLGGALVNLKNLDTTEYRHFAVEILSTEGIQNSKIEGEILDRESLQSSIKRHFGISTSQDREINKEFQMAKVLCDVYESFNKPLTHEMLWQWHFDLFKLHTHIDEKGKYRTHAEPMQIVSTKCGSRKVFFEAPPSIKVFDEMNNFIDWFNSSKKSELTLGRAAIAHVYFESIHPFEDGNGRIGRMLVEKILSQGFDQPILIAVSKVLERRKKEYYAALERCNQTLEIDHWAGFFADVILEAQSESNQLLDFLINKSKMMATLAGQLNTRQEKVLLRIFAEGINGFKGGLSAEKYIAITKASRATATRDLSDLVRMGALVKTGELRHTRYWLNL